MIEEWKSVVDYEGYYSVSNFGRVRGDKEYRGKFVGRILVPYINKRGYPTVQLNRNSKGKTFSIHKLVANAFIGPMPVGYQVNHKDTIKLNNFISNLEYCTNQENMLHAKLNGLMLNKENHPLAKLTNEQVLEIRRDYKPHMNTYKMLGDKYGVHRTCIGLIIRNKNWISTNN